MSEKIAPNVPEVINAETINGVRHVEIMTTCRGCNDPLDTYECRGLCKQCTGDTYNDN